MAKVSEMIGDFAAPQGEGGRAVPWEVANRIAGEIRQVMNEDLSEEDMAVQAYCLNIYLQRDQDELIAAWDLLNARERRAWKELVRLGNVR